LHPAGWQHIQRLLSHILRQIGKALSELKAWELLKLGLTVRNKYLHHAECHNNVSFLQGAAALSQIFWIKHLL
jgi:hypothetical protein